MTDQTFEEVETPEATDEVETVEAAPEPAKTETKAKRPQLPDGFGTPIQFAHALTAKLRAEGKLEENEDFKPQVVYSYIKNRAKENPIPVVYVNPEGEVKADPTDGYRPAFRKDADGNLAEALAWWDEKEKRVAERKANAAAKAAKKAEKATTKSDAPASETVEVADEPVVDEAE